MRLPSLLLAWLAAATPAAPVGVPAEAAVRAVVAAVQVRMGADADVVVDQVHEVSLVGGTLVDAVPAPGAKLGAAARFVLRGVGATVADPGRMTPVGHATVTVRVVADHAHTARAVRRGAALEAADLVPARHGFDAGPLTRPPAIEDALHGRVLRDLPAGACLTHQAFTATPPVRAGGDVVAVMRVGDIEVRADLVAVDSGQRGDLVRVINPKSRRTFRARVVSRDLVEISHE